jgi:hypothetical protein
MPEVAGALFYESLSTLSPDFRSLFKNDMRIQGVTHGDRLQPASARPGPAGGQRYGVKPADYDTLEDALLWTLEQVLAEDFTPAVHDASAVCYRETCRRNEGGPRAWA